MHDATGAFSLLFSAAVLLQLLVNLWLSTRQARHVAHHRLQVPGDFASRIRLEAHQRAADYTLAKLRFGLIMSAVNTLVLIGWTLLGGLDCLNQALLASVLPAWGPMAYQLSVLCLFMMINGLIDLPATLWRTFRLEQAFGFNRMTAALFWRDTLKGLLISAVIGLPLALLLLALMRATGDWWWLAGWATWTGFSLLMLAIFPTWIAPLFNRFEPLLDQPLNTRIAQLMQRSGFQAKGLFVMDGSKRSAHANAYFTGFGASKRVVFFDTLIAKLSVDEIEAVLAHELGHFKHRHVLKRILGMLVMSGLGFALLGWLSTRSWFYLGLGVTPHIEAPHHAVALLLFLLAGPVFSTFISPALSALSRQHEFEADRYASQQVDAQHLISALIKLYQDNAATLTPDPLYARFHYSHPPATQRIAALRQQPSVDSVAAT